MDLCYHQNTHRCCQEDLTLDAQNENKLMVLDSRDLSTAKETYKLTLWLTDSKQKLFDEGFNDFLAECGVHKSGKKYVYVKPECVKPECVKPIVLDSRDLSTANKVYKSTLWLTAYRYP